MRPFLLVLSILTLGISAFSQRFSPDPDLSEVENVYAERLAGDERNTTFLIWVKLLVAPHYHAAHSETVTVLEGRAEMFLGDVWFDIGPGDVVFIPQGTIHAVLVAEGILKVTSVQSPEFDGSDRILVDKEDQPEVLRSRFYAK